MVDAPQWWQWPTVLSLDAPAVCVVWHALLAHVAGTEPGAAQITVLGASVWLAYAADRWIEAWRLNPEDIRTQRHHFYLRRRWIIAAIWPLVFAADVWVAATTLPPRHLIAGVLLSLLVLIYLVSHQLVHRHRRWRVPKEVCIAALLTAGVTLFLVPAPYPWALALSATLFGLLCFSNCVLISRWEQEVDLAHGQSSLAVGGGRYTWMIPLVPWLVSVIALASTTVSLGATQLASVCALASAASLGLVDRMEPRTGRRVARVLSDVALLAPVIPLVALL